MRDLNFLFLHSSDTEENTCRAETSVGLRHIKIGEVDCMLKIFFLLFPMWINSEKKNSD